MENIAYFCHTPLQCFHVFSSVCHINMQSNLLIQIQFHHRSMYDADALLNIYYINKRKMSLDTLIWKNLLDLHSLTEGITWSVDRAMHRD